MDRSANTFNFLIVFLGIVCTQQVRAVDNKILKPCESTVKNDWYDETHMYLSTLVCRPSLWFDSFFKNKEHLDRTAGTSVRLITKERLQQNTLPDLRHRIATRVHLPDIHNRLHLLVEGEKQRFFSDDDPSDPIADFIYQPVSAGIVNEQHAQVGLMWNFLHKETYYLKATGHLKTPNIGHAKLSGFYRHDFSEEFSTSIGEDLTWEAVGRIKKQKEFKGTKAYRQHSWLNFDTNLGKQFLLRLGNDIDTEGERWVRPRWSQGLSLMQKIGTYEAISYSVSWSGPGSPWHTDTYTLSSQWQSKSFRRWLIFGFSPFIEWQKINSFRGRAGFTVSLELDIGQVNS